MHSMKYTFHTSSMVHERVSVGAVLFLSFFAFIFIFNFMFLCF